MLETNKISPNQYVLTCENPLIQFPKTQETARILEKQHKLNDVLLKSLTCVTLHASESLE